MASSRRMHCAWVAGLFFTGCAGLFGQDRGATAPTAEGPDAGAAKAGAASSAAPHPAPNQAPLHTTAERTFRIPFSLPGQSEHAEVQLYVSADQGKSWQLYARKVAKQDNSRFARTTMGSIGLLRERSISGCRRPRPRTWPPKCGSPSIRTSPIWS